MKELLSLIRLMRINRKRLFVGDVQNKYTDYVFKTLIAIIIAGTTFWGGLQIAEVVPDLVAPNSNLISLLKIFFAVYTFLIIVLSFVNIINTLYMSDEILLLMAMPFSEWQIVGAEIVCEIKTALYISVFLLFPFSAALGYYADKSALFYTALLITSVLLPVFTICITTSVIMLLFKLFGVLKSRNFIKFLGCVFGIVLCFAFAAVFNNGTMETKALSAMSVIDKYEKFFPSVYIAGLLLDQFSLSHILELFAITVGAGIVTAILAKLFYLNTALNMKEIGGKRKATSVEAISKKYNSKSPIRTVMEKDIKTTVRTPAYLITGYLVTYGFPLLMIIISIFEKQSSETLNLTSLQISSREAFITAAASTVFYTIFIAGMNAVALTPLSREGSRFFLLKQMPLSAKTIMSGKIFAALFVCGIPTVGYFLVVGIILLALRRLAWYYLLYILVLNIAVLINVINLNAFVDVLKPTLDWGEEAEMLKAKGVAKFLWILLLLFTVLLSGLVILLLPSLKISAIVILILFVVLDIILYKLIIYSAEKKFAQI